MHDGSVSELFDAVRAARRAESMARHPSARIGGGDSIPPQYRVPQDNQAGAAELLAKITAPPLSTFEEAAMETYAELMDLLVQKHHDYGPHNIGRSPGGPLNGLRVRMWDKLARINNLVDNDTDPRNESVRDSFVDLANYAAIGVMVIDGVWPRD